MLLRFNRSIPMILILMVLSFTSIAIAQTNKPTAKPDANNKASVSDGGARDFVTKCYETYKKNNWSTDDLSKMKDWFTPELYQLLQKDADDEEDGLDFDPFYNAQENPNSFKIGNATVTGNKTIIEVDNFFGKDKLVVNVELVKNGDKWQIDNFIYPPDSNLLQILKPSK